MYAYCSFVNFIQCISAYRIPLPALPITTIKAALISTRTIIYYKYRIPHLPQQRSPETLKL